MHENDNIRKYGPPIHEINRIEIPLFQHFTLDNGIPVYYINDGSQELTKLDIVFRGGRHFEAKRSVSRVFAGLLKEGTEKMNSVEISNFMDYHGASYNTRSSLDFTTVTLFSLSRFFPKLVECTCDMLLRPTFPITELRKYIDTSIERLELDNAKNEIAAYKRLTELMYGSKHVYGYNSTEESYRKIEQEHILAYYKNLIQSQQCVLFLCGRFGDEVIKSLNQHFGQWNYSGKGDIDYVVRAVTPKRERISSEQDLQVAFRMGRYFGNRKNPDYSRLSFLSNVFGGFFGSRLMSNIREERGLTYNIFSDLDSMLFDGYFYISSEMAAENVDEARDQIYLEMRELRENIIELEELTMNRNYIMGNLLNAIDGPFNSMRLVKSSVLNNRSREEITQVISDFMHIDEETLRETAKKYLNPEDFFEVIVG